MKLTSIQLHNFRQFYGESLRLELSSPDSRKNVVVFHGVNGSGKTALLNAFTWALYSEHTRGFNPNNNLVNRHALAKAEIGDLVEAWVELRFTHGEYRHVLRRTVREEKMENGTSMHRDTTAKLDRAGDDGEWKSMEKVAETIGRILPKDLHNYFFFDGERIDRIMHPDKEDQKRLGEATKKLLGIEVLTRGADHLKSAQKKLEGQLKQVGNSETREILEAKEKYEAEQATIESELKQIERNIDGFKKQKKRIEEQLRQAKDAHQIQSKRDRLEEQAEKSREERKNIRAERSRLISEESFVLFIRSPIKKLQILTDNLRARGELPSGIKRKFVDDLLEQFKCICERPLDTGTPPRIAVEGWRSKAGLDDVEESVIRMGAEVKELEKLQGSVAQQLERSWEREKKVKDTLSRVELELDDIKKELANSPAGEVSSMAAQHTTAENSIDEHNRVVGQKSAHLKDVTAKIEDLGRQLQEQEAIEARHGKVQNYIAAATKAYDLMVESRARFETGFRKSLTQKIEQAFSSMSITSYVPELTSGWGLQLLDTSGGNPTPVAASTGERQVLSLSFIASIIQQARELEKKDSYLSDPARSVYPVVMDSPFGSLDPEYRGQVAAKLPEAADQVLVLVTQTQWREEVERALMGRLLRSYVLTYYTLGDDVEEKEIVIDGEGYPSVRRSQSDFEYTTITEVRHD